jgi:hypothetical protein
MQPKKKPSLGGDILKLITYCPLCEAAYSPLRARVLEERADAHLLHIQCANCGSAIVATVMNSGLGLTSIGLITDLTGDDVLRFKDEQSVTTDDVLNVHNLLYPKN